jgi:hypothetical protein
MGRNVFAAQLTAILAGLAMLAAPASAEGPWMEIANRDLDAIQALLQANHPGPVDAEHPYFREWMQKGMVEARGKAAAARNFRDYKWTLLTYLNGFRDDHTRVNLLVDAARQEWPGFLPKLNEDGTVTVGTSTLPNVKEGDRILSCDGLSLPQLFEERVALIRWNRDIESQRYLHFPRTLLIDYGDTDSKLRSCSVDGGSGPVTVNLEWRLLSFDEALAARRRAIGTSAVELGLRKIDGVWFLSMPSFNYWGSDSVSAFRDVQKRVQKNIDDIRSGILVIDLRGNLGGMSSWADDIAATLWSPAWVEGIKSNIEYVVDWRASTSNLARIEALIARMDRDQLDARELEDVRALMKAALAAGQPLARQSTRPQPRQMPDSSPFKGRAYLLTDYYCVSACLDFSDVMLRLPRVTHIGQATGADALFIDTDSAPLPSGLASLTYSNKVYRKRVRGHNEGYEPKHRWPGGVMTFEALAKWVRSLPGE